MPPLAQHVIADLRKARQRLYRQELRERKAIGNRITYTEGKCEGESIGLSYAILEIDRIIKRHSL